MLTFILLTSLFVQIVYSNCQFEYKLPYDLYSSFMSIEDYTMIGDNYYYFDKKYLSTTNDVIMRQNTNIIAHTNSFMFSWFNAINIYDCNDKKLFSIINVNPTYYLNFFKTSYHILNTNSDIIGHIEYCSYLTTSVIIFSDVNNELVAEAKLDYWLIRDIWIVTVHNKLSKIADIKLTGMFISYKQFESYSNNDDNNYANLLINTPINLIHQFQKSNVSNMLLMSNTKPQLPNKSNNINMSKEFIIISCVCIILILCTVLICVLFGFVRRRVILYERITEMTPLNQNDFYVPYNV